MKPELMRIKIAGAVGWQTAHGGKYCMSALSNLALPTLFDPLNDLNAMHEAENQLTEEEWNRYASKLSVVVGDAMLGDYKSSYVVRATAAQRAEAFLRTIGAWTEDTATV